MNKKMYLIFLVVGAILTFSSCSNKETNVIKVGAILPLTGDLASYGVDTRKALELAEEQINLKGGIDGKNVKVIFEDSKGTSALAATAINKLTSVDKVIGILGPITSPEVLSISPIANSNKTPIISPSSTSIDISKAGPYVFRTINADNIETLAFAHFIKEKLDSPNVGIIADRAAGTLSYAESFEKYYKADGGLIVGKEIFQENLKDFRSEILKLLNIKDIQAIYVSGVSMEIGLITKQIRGYNKKIQIISYQSAEDRRVVELAGNTVNGMIYSSTTLPENYLGKAREDFVTEFQKKYGHVPGIFAAEIYDGINILLDAYSKGIKNNEPLINYLKNAKDYQGASGKITFDENGDVHKAVAIYEYNVTTPDCLYIVEGNDFIPVNKGKR